MGIILCLVAGTAGANTVSGSRTALIQQSAPPVTEGDGAGMIVTNLTNVSVNSLAQSLAGEGVVITNVTYTGTDWSAGRFTNGTDVIGFNEGVVLSSGDIWGVEGPNTQDGYTRNNGLAGDSDLDILIPGYTTHDATVLAFDFVPKSKVVTFQYVFASDEYNEYVHTSYNDVFGFYVNGKNIAIVPGTDINVSINTINNGNPYGSLPNNSPEYYRNNDLSDGGGSLETEMDGLTTVFTATSSVRPGELNHMKLAIADAGDWILDSNVMIEAGSLSAKSLTLEPVYTENYVGKTQNLVATLVDEKGNPVSDESINFTIVNGPNKGVSEEISTNVLGVAIFSYGSAVNGTDTIVAATADATSNNAYTSWLDAIKPTCDYEIVLYPGWNFISTPKVLERGSDTALIFADIDTDGHSIWQYNAMGRSWHAMTASDKVKVLDGIWIYSRDLASIPLIFNKDPLVAPPMKICYQGWNAVGFSDTTSASARDTFLSIQGKWTTVIGFDAEKQAMEASVISGSSSGTHSEDRELYPTKGYWLYANDDTELAAIAV